MIFLGAGASKTFGIKTLQEMSKDLIKIMEKKGYSDIVTKITDSLKRFGVSADFEAIYTIVEGLINPEQAVKNSGSFTAYVCKDLNEVKPKQDLKSLLQVFKAYLWEECKPKRGSSETLESVFDRLFQITKGSDKTEKRYIAGVENKPSVNVGYNIATTNYDMLIESYHENKEQSYADGFRLVTEKPFIKELDLATYSQKRERWLIKLHGSIWQYKYKDSIFKTIGDPENYHLPVEIEEEMLIYPTGEKPILSQPYYGFYNVFKMQNWKKLIAIGYSFRDDPVNIAIIENLMKNQRSCLIVVDPKPKVAIQNLGVLPEFDERVIPVKGGFGEEAVFKKLEIALKVDSKHRYFERASVGGIVHRSEIKELS